MTFSLCDWFLLMTYFKVSTKTTSLSSLLVFLFSHSFICSFIHLLMNLLNICWTHLLCTRPCFKVWKTAMNQTNSTCHYGAPILEGRLENKQGNTYLLFVVLNTRKKSKADERKKEWFEWSKMLKGGPVPVENWLWGVQFRKTELCPNAFPLISASSGHCCVLALFISQVLIFKFFVVTFKHVK